MNKVCMARIDGTEKELVRIDASGGRELEHGGGRSEETLFRRSSIFSSLGFLEI